jgi:hypothetical protein
MKKAEFAKHTLIAMIGSMFVGGFLSIVIGLVVGRVVPGYWVLLRLLTDVPYSPLFWGSGLPLGFLVNRRTLSGGACWVWIAGILWLGLGALTSYSPYRNHPWYNPPWCPPQGCSFLEQIRDNLFDLKGDRCGGSECAGEFLFTAPAFCSIAYSIGALLALRSKRPGGKLFARGQTGA